MIGLLIGRFQPFHKGHLYLLKQALKKVDKLIIGIGSANVSDEKNPISAIDRVKIIRELIKAENLQDKIINVVEINDFPGEDEKWLINVKKVVGNFDVFIGNDEFTFKIFQKNNIQILNTPLFKIREYSGTVVRNLKKNNQVWKNKIPKSIQNLVSTRLNK